MSRRFKIYAPTFIDLLGATTLESGKLNSVIVLLYEKGTQSPGCPGSLELMTLPPVVWQVRHRELPFLSVKLLRF